MLNLFRDSAYGIGDSIVIPRFWVLNQCGNEVWDSSIVLEDPIFAYLPAMYLCKCGIFFFGEDWGKINRQRSLVM